MPSPASPYALNSAAVAISAPPASSVPMVPLVREGVMSACNISPFCLHMLMPEDSASLTSALVVAHVMLLPVELHAQFLPHWTWACVKHDTCDAESDTGVGWLPGGTSA